MVCYNPMQAKYLVRGDGKKDVKFSNTLASAFASGHDLSDFGDDNLTLPCGKCIGCKLERSRQWALRCMNEASCYEDNCFLTLTYDDDHLPLNGSLEKRDFQLFMKRLRAKFSDTKIRFYHCGEYGELLSRPHYHALLFGFDFPDKKLFYTRDGKRFYTSDICSDLWGFGHCEISDLTFDSAAYVTRYCTKVVSGSAAEGHYGLRSPEYSTMSRRPGIGRPWFDKFKTDVFPSDNMVVNGHLCKPPRYYDDLLAKHDPAVMAKIKELRVVRSERFSDDNTCRRLNDRLICKEAQLKNLKRKLES